jgi:hypothetical protein
MGCPVIVEGNAATMPQERPNLDWIEENGVGLVVRNFSRDIAEAAGRMLADLPQFKANIDRNIPENRAIFEIADHLADIIDQPADPSLKRSRPAPAKTRLASWPAGTLLRKHRKPRR